ncbi:MAG TPA: AraC family transcriptional regulator [Anaerolineales bacterium]|nr:AraC family transcriptional regulator [Anaerolineales bacterium]HLO30155.1 AraC family transcriptional regulator [Anaerolineales bacterium]
MQTKEWTKIWHNPQLDVGLLHAYYVQHAYPRHSHDYYVITLIERGRQSFTHKGTKYLTPPGGIILINPGEVHTGEAADEHGFEMRSLYPTTALMQTAAFELTGRQQALPFFKEVRVDQRWASNSILSLHKALTQGAGTLERETRLLWTLAQLIQRYANLSSTEKPVGKEKKAIRQARSYLEECFAERITLNQLAQQVALSPYYFLRAFRAEAGMPPYEYLESVRIRHAQQLIEAGKPLAEVAIEVGFSSQSQLTRHFKKIIGVTPGQYAQQVRD